MKAETGLPAEICRLTTRMNPNKDLRVFDPKRYDNDQTIYENLSPLRTTQLMESSGILLQLFSRFVTEESVKKTSEIHYTET